MKPSEELGPFARFVQECFSRLKLGQAVYGNTMFVQYDPLKVCQDIKEEIWDAFNYLYALHQKIEAIEYHISKSRVDEWWEREGTNGTDGSSNE